MTAMPSAPATPGTRPAGDPAPSGGHHALIGRLRWAVRAVLVLGVAASVVANVLHAAANPISQAIAGWPPIALLLTVELISRIPLHSRVLATVRLIATATIAAIAAWVSYWHMVGVASRYGESPSSAHLLPLSVDGLIVVASLSLVELSARHEPASSPAPSKSAETGALATTDHTGTADDTTTSDAPIPSSVEHSGVEATASGDDPGESRRAAMRTSRPADASRARAPVNFPPGRADRDKESPGTPTPARVTAVQLRQQHPDMGPDEISRRVGKSVRQVHRYLAQG